MRPREELLQTLWGGYGRLVRRASHEGTEIVKDIRWPPGDGDRSHRRKLRSYQIEARWYEHWISRVPAVCRVPSCRRIEPRPDGIVLVLEDLDSVGFQRRSTLRRRNDLDAAIAWLARFHATFLGASPDGLWKEGSYWHLATRPDELKAMPPGPLRDAAPDLDRRLAQARFRTIIHGDAKPDNFCLGDRGRIAAVDFQYVGGGCGMRDLAYLLYCVHDQAFGGPETDRSVEAYFGVFRGSLPPPFAPHAEAIESEWRALLPVAWLDFQRFLQGWSPAYARPSVALARRIDDELGRLGS